MTSKSPVNSVHCPGRVPSNYDRALLTPPPERHSQLTRQRGGLISIPGKLKPPMSGASRRLTKLLLNVTIQHSFGPVQVVTSPENTVGDLIKEALAIYVKEKRRPLVKQTNPECFELHYSQFSLESLKTGEKLINLGSRNFFLCQKPAKSLDSSCYEEAMSLFPFTKFMDFLL
ncbi:hypothetical protein PVL29_001969 [Vitis rotundifolia]|uniref:DUF7054 domain-containing protein n=1 Tax=Vitis rotundifolia TaxID=103349 RepID=A0AA39AFN8_VITRO|nr:hypothetical protein PVL29_001969 [Vitis rotundifolia]